jgi:hypothetical protein
MKKINLTLCILIGLSFVACSHGAKHGENRGDVAYYAVSVIQPTEFNWS